MPLVGFAGVKGLLASLKLAGATGAAPSGAEGITHPPPMRDGRASLKKAGRARRKPKLSAVQRPARRAGAQARSRGARLRRESLDGVARCRTDRGDVRREV